MYTSGFKNMRSDKRHRHAFEVYAHLPKQGIIGCKVTNLFQNDKRKHKIFPYPYLCMEPRGH